jgi:hypothetical protein
VREREQFGHWIEPLVKKVVSQRRDLSEEELEKIGTKIATKIAWAQGAASSHRSSLRVSSSLLFGFMTFQRCYTCTNTSTKLYSTLTSNSPYPSSKLDGGEYDI